VIKTAEKSIADNVIELSAYKYTAKCISESVKDGGRCRIVTLHNQILSVMSYSSIKDIINKIIIESKEIQTILLIDITNHNSLSYNLSATDYAVGFNRERRLQDSDRQVFDDIITTMVCFNNSKLEQKLTRNIH